MNRYTIHKKTNLPLELSTPVALKYLACPAQHSYKKKEFHHFKGLGLSFQALANRVSVHISTYNIDAILQCTNVHMLHSNVSASAGRSSELLPLPPGRSSSASSMHSTLVLLSSSQFKMNARMLSLILYFVILYYVVQSLQLTTIQSRGNVFFYSEQNFLAFAFNKVLKSIFIHHLMEFHNDTVTKILILFKYSYYCL